MERFQDARQHLWSISQRILVECPRCRAQGEVLREGPTFTCGRCGHNLRGQAGHWAGMAKTAVKRNCGWCGRLLSRTERRLGPHPCKVGVCCPGCSHWNFVAAYWKPDPQDDPYDPHFGFRLWLQTRCAGEVLWAYNAEHLSFLREYVNASLRERTPNANGSLASRLPKWIKRAQNRPAVLRATRRLEAKLAG